MYQYFSLNGTWEMFYTEEPYIGTVNPWDNKNAVEIENAIPGYWEDMKEDFARAPFFDSLKINPGYGTQSYPIAGAVLDMALPNIMGNFFYRRTFCSDGINQPTVLHFDGVQNAVSVWINNVFLGRHEGYSTPFDMEVPAGTLFDGENTIVLSVSNIGLTGYDGEPVSIV